MFTGKTHTVEFAFDGLGVNSHWGTPRNPWTPPFTESPGVPAAVAGRQPDRRLGNSCVRVGHSRFCSHSGFADRYRWIENDHGRWPLAGICPLSPTLDTSGLLARTATDMLFAFAGIDPQIQRSYSALLDRVDHLNAADIVIATAEPKLWQDCGPGIAEAVDTALSELSRRGVQVINLPIPEVADAIELLHAGNVVVYELGELLKSELPDWLETLDPVVSADLKDGVSISIEEISAATAAARRTSTQRP